MINLLKKIILTSTTSLLIATPIHAFEIISAEDINSGGDGTIASLDRTKNAETEFLNKLTTNIGTEDFEAYSWETSANLNLSFPGAGTATLGGNGRVYCIEHIEGVTDANTIDIELNNGRYASSGTNYWHTSATVGDSSTFMIDLTEEIAAFGFYAYDLGDFGGELEIKLYQDGEIVTTISNTSHRLYTSTVDGAYTGSAVYIGIIGEQKDDGTYETFDQVEFVIANMAGSAEDFFAFDDMTIATPQQLLKVYAD